MRDRAAPLQAAVSQLSQEHPALRFGWGMPEAAFRSFARLGEQGDETLEALLAATRQLAPGLDGKTAASYLLSILTWELGQVLGALYLSRLPLPAFGPEHVGVRHRLLGEEGGRSLEFDFCVAFDGQGEVLDRDAMATSIVALLTPMVEGLHARARLARRAIWSLGTDGISAGFLGFGKDVGETELAMAEAEGVLRRHGSPLFNSRWRFATVEAGGAREAFRLRGGCCRLYRSPDYPFCTTCVLRDESDQIDRLQAYLRSVAG